MNKGVRTKNGARECFHIREFWKEKKPTKKTENKQPDKSEENQEAK